MSVVDKILAASKGEPPKHVSIPASTDALQDSMDALMWDGLDPVFSEDGESSLEPIRTMQASLKVKSEALPSRRTALGILFTAATSGSDISSHTELVMDSLTKPGRVEGTLEKIDSLLVSMVFDLVHPIPLRTVSSLSPRSQGSVQSISQPPVTQPTVDEACCP